MLIFINKKIHLKNDYPFDPLIKNHIIIGILLVVWIFIFLYFTEPLDVNQLSDNEKLIYLPGYGLVGGVCYVLFLPFQYYLYKLSKWRWTGFKEIIYLISFSIVSVTIARNYYLWIIVSNEPNPYSLTYMLKSIFLPALATILPIIIIGRFAFGKYHEKRLNDNKIEIKGEGNYEGLRLQLNELISIQSSDNYIEVFYITGHQLKKTLIRNKLSSIADEFPELLRAHRSFLINPFHFRQWKTENGKLIICLSHDIEVPVSKTYQKAVKAAF